MNPNNDLCNMIKSIHNCMDVKYTIDGNEHIKSISKFSKKEFLDIFFGGLINMDKKDENRYENLLVNGSGIDNDSKLYSKLTQIYGFTKINNSDIYRPVILNGVDYLNYLKTWDSYETRKKWFEKWILVVETIWKQLLEKESVKDMNVEKYFFKNSSIISFVINGNIFMDKNKNKEKEFERISPYFLLVLDYMMMNCLYKYNNFDLIQKIDEPRNEIDRLNQLIYFVEIMHKKGYEIDIFNFSDSYENLNILLDKNKNWNFERNYKKNDDINKDGTTIWFKTKTDIMEIENDNFLKEKYVKSYEIYNNVSNPKDMDKPLVLSFYLDSNRKTKKDVDIFEIYKDEFRKYDIIIGDFNTKGIEAANTVLDFAMEVVNDMSYNTNSIFKIITNKKRRVPLQSQMGKNGLDPSNEQNIPKIKDWIIIPNGTTEIHVFDLSGNEYTDDNYNNIPEIPKYDHFTDHFVVYRHFIKNGKKYGIAQLNVAAFQNSPYEFYISELKDLYNIVYDDWLSDELISDDIMLCLE